MSVNNFVLRTAAIIGAFFLLGACATAPAGSPAQEQAGVRQLLAEAYAHMQRKDDAAAEKALYEARQLDPDNPWIALDLGVIFQRQGYAEQARSEYRRALASPRADDPAKQISGSLPDATAAGIARYNLDLLKQQSGRVQQ